MIDDGLLEQRNAQWLKGTLDLCVLGVLRDGEAYGYQLARLLGEAGMGVIKGGTLYPILKRLELDGLVSVVWRDSESGPNRKYYTLTGSGREMLDRAGKEWETYAATVSRIIHGE